jgi:hypothetical protein
MHLLTNGNFSSVANMKTNAIEIFRKNGRQLRMSEVIAHGITRYMLYSLRDKGIIEQLSRGVYRLVELPPMSNPDLITVSLPFPNEAYISGIDSH